MERCKKCYFLTNIDRLLLLRRKEIEYIVKDLYHSVWDLPVKLYQAKSCLIYATMLKKDLLKNDDSRKDVYNLHDINKTVNHTTQLPSNICSIIGDYSVCCKNQYVNRLGVLHRLLDDLIFTSLGKFNLILNPNIEEIHFCCSSIYSTCLNISSFTTHINLYAYFYDKKIPTKYEIVLLYNLFVYNWSAIKNYDNAITLYSKVNKIIKDNNKKTKCTIL